METRLVKRDLTNKIRFVLDELLPPLIRDSRWFMWPLFALAYRRFDVRAIMEFKQQAYRMSDAEYAAFYAQLDNSISRRRITDLNEQCLAFIETLLRNDPAGHLKNALDVGAGNGHLLEVMAGIRPDLQLTGVDAAPAATSPAGIQRFTALLPSLPFPDRCFDLVTCTHVIEHVPDLSAGVNELLRVTRQTLVVVVPRQRYYRYTLDEHLNFFPQVEPLVHLMGRRPTVASLLGGDWLLQVDCRSPEATLQ
jgi:ubiquinone/menaquinone biosynthesis C-methylase UbiE